MAVLADVDLTDLDNFAHGFPHELFARHRAEAPVFWHEPTAHTPDGEGFWSVATYDDVLGVLHDPATYSSVTGGDRPYGGTILQDLPVAGVVLNMMDDPRHAAIRRLVTKGLTPAMVRTLRADLLRRTRALLEAAAGTCDFLTDVAAELPMQAICFLLGVPEADRHRLFACVEHIFDLPDEGDYLAMTPERAAAVGELAAYGTALIEERRRHPGTDLLSVAVHARLADADPPTLTDAELGSFFSLLFSAGAETTRNAIAGGLLALVEHPDQLAVLREAARADAARADAARAEGPWPAAVEEVLRWTTPSPSKRRTATGRAVLGGQHVAPGDKVVVWEGSANRDASRFAAPMTFDTARDPNPHLAFGHGVHFCLGAHLARLETDLVLREVLTTFATIEPTGPVEWTRSNRHTGYRHVPLRLGRA